MDRLDGVRSIDRRVTPARTTSGVAADRDVADPGDGPVPARLRPTDPSGRRRRNRSAGGPADSRPSSAGVRSRRRRSRSGPRVPLAARVERRCGDVAVAARAEAGKERADEQPEPVHLRRRADHQQVDVGSGGRRRVASVQHADGVVAARGRRPSPGPDGRWCRTGCRTRSGCPSDVLLPSAGGVPAGAGTRGASPDHRDGTGSGAAEGRSAPSGRADAPRRRNLRAGQPADG